MIPGLPMEDYLSVGGLIRLMVHGYCSDMLLAWQLYYIQTAIDNALDGYIPA
jgi:hypothetical protein